MYNIQMCLSQHHHPDADTDTALSLHTFHQHQLWEMKDAHLVFTTDYMLIFDISDRRCQTSEQKVVLSRLRYNVQDPTNLKRQ